MKKLIEIIKASLMMLGLMTFLCGLLYTLTVTGIAQVFFPDLANGSQISVIDQGGKSVIVGSELIGQEFTAPQFLQGRPKAGPSNLSPVSPEQQGIIAERIKTLLKENGSNEEIPSELVLASGSGLDPEISRLAADYQIPRLVETTDLNQAEITRLLDKHTKGRLFGKIGDERVNVLQVNLELANFQVK